MEINEDAQQIMKYVKIIFLGTGGGHLLFHRFSLMGGVAYVVPLFGGGYLLFHWSEGEVRCSLFHCLQGRGSKCLQRGAPQFIRRWGGRAAQRPASGRTEALS